ncbi:MAG: E3 SUMO-protein ligase pli1, partial [Paramarteilia canceri]
KTCLGSKYLKLKQHGSFISAEDDLACSNSATLSLMDPIALTQITCPIRSRICTHLECFDLDIMLDALEIGSKTTLFENCEEQITCFLCKNNFYIDQIYIDNFFSQILANYSGMESVYITLLENGKLEILDKDPDINENPEEIIDLTASLEIDSQISENSFNDLEIDFADAQNMPSINQGPMLKDSDDSESIIVLD